jgi:hypothetical protein
MSTITNVGTTTSPNWVRAVSTTQGTTSTVTITSTTDWMTDPYPVIVIFNNKTVNSTTGAVTIVPITLIDETMATPSSASVIYSQNVFLTAYDLLETGNITDGTPYTDLNTEINLASVPFHMHIMQLQYPII